MATTNQQIWRGRLERGVIELALILLAAWPVMLLYGVLADWVDEPGIALPYWFWVFVLAFWSAVLAAIKWSWKRWRSCGRERSHG